MSLNVKGIGFDISVIFEFGKYFSIALVSWFVIDTKYTFFLRIFFRNSKLICLKNSMCIAYHRPPKIFDAAALRDKMSDEKNKDIKRPD